MQAPKHKKTRTYHLVPIEGITIPGVPAREQDVDEAEARRIAAYRPSAFHITPPLPAQSAPKEG